MNRRGFLSRFFYDWVRIILKKGLRKELCDDCFNLENSWSSRNIVGDLDLTPLDKAFYIPSRKAWLIAVGLGILETVAALVRSFLFFRALVAFMGDQSQVEWFGYLLVGIILVLDFIGVQARSSSQDYAFRSFLIGQAYFEKIVLWKAFKLNYSEKTKAAVSKLLVTSSSLIMHIFFNR
jgi:hypothetical protein